MSDCGYYMDQRLFVDELKSLTAGVKMSVVKNMFYHYIGIIKCRKQQIVEIMNLIVIKKLVRELIKKL